jgi:hypothetical protein
MTKIIPNSFKNARCKDCDRRFAVGEDVRWTKGGGATCVQCPPQQQLPLQPQAAPQYGTDTQALITTIGELVKARDAALSDGQALRKRIGELEAQLATSEHVRLALMDDRGRLLEERNEARRECETLKATTEHEPWLGDPAVTAAAQLSQPALVEAANNALDLDDCDL